MHDDTPRIGPWTLHELVGRGGNAEVWRAEHPDGGEAAIKLLLRPDPISEERLRLESSALQALNHPHIVSALDLLEHEGRLAMVLEYVSGPALSSWARGRPEHEVVQLFLQVLDAVGAAHQAGIVHRDLKPANILLTTARPVCAKVADFGVARGPDRADLTRTGTVLGTPAYMAPEQVTSPSDVGPMSDVFALGATLYELLCGRPAFMGHTALQVLDRARHGLYPSPRTLEPDLSDAVCAALDGALRPDPAERIPDVETLRDVLLGVVPWRVHVPLAAAATWAAAPVEPLVGRADLLRQVEVALQGELVTLTGPIGVGKTAVALHIAQEWRGPVIVVDVSEAHDEADVVRCVAQTLDIRLPWMALDQLDDAVKAALGVQRGLLVIDGLVVDDGAARRVAGWAPSTSSVLVTSPGPLEVAGERVIRLAPLDDADAVALLRRLAPDATDDDEVLADVLQAVGTLPLALTLFAPLLQETTADDALHAWSRSSQRDTLGRIVRRSWQSLSADEATVLAELSVFQDGFRSEAAEVVVRLPDRAPIRPVLAALRRKCLLYQAPSPAQPGRSRLRLYPHVQQFAREALGSQTATVQERYVQWAASLGAARATWTTRGGDQRLAALHAERANLWAAHTLASGDDRGLITLALREVLSEAGPLDDAIRVSREAAATCHDAALWAEQIMSWSFDTVVSGDTAAAVTICQDALADPRASACRGRLLESLGTTLGRRGDLEEALALLADALQYDCTPARRANTQRNRAHLLLALHRVPEAARELDACSEFFEKHASMRQQAFFRMFRGELLAHRRMDYRPDLHTAIQLFRRVGLARGAAVAYRMLVVVLLLQGHLDECESLLPDMLALARGQGLREREVYALLVQASCHMLRGRLDEALDATDAAELVASHLDAPHVHRELAYTRAVVALACADPVSAHTACADGLTMAPNPSLKAVAARCAAELGDVSRARALLAELDAHTATPDVGAGLHVHSAAALATLGDVDAAWAEAAAADRAAEAAGMGPQSYVRQQLAQLVIPPASTSRYPSTREGG